MMKKMMSIAAVALFMAGSSVFACESCGCQPKKAKSECSACPADKKADAKKCGSDCAKACCTKKADA